MRLCKYNLGVIQILYDEDTTASKICRGMQAMNEEACSKEYASPYTAEAPYSGRVPSFGKHKVAQCNKEHCRISAGRCWVILFNSGCSYHIFCPLKKAMKGNYVFSSQVVHDSVEEWLHQLPSS